MQIVLEAGTHSPWVSRLLESQGHEVIVANARKVRLIYERDRKNDRLDARMFARLGRVDVSLLAPVRHRGAETQTDLAVVIGRDALVAARTQLVNAVRGMVKTAGGRLPKSTTAAFSRKVLPLIPAELKLAVKPLLASIAALTEQIRHADEQGTIMSGSSPSLDRQPRAKSLRAASVSGQGALITAPFASAQLSRIPLASREHSL